MFTEQTIVTHSGGSESEIGREVKQNRILLENSQKTNEWGKGEQKAETIGLQSNYF